MDDAARFQPAAPLVAAVVEHARSVTIDSLPLAAVESAKTFLLDCFGVAIVGSLTPESQRLPSLVAGWGSGDDASVWGREERLPAPSAALVNAHQMHCLEFDCVHEPAVVHALTVVTPVLVAWMQREARKDGRKISGAEVIVGAAVGVDVAGGLGDVTTSPLRFFRPATNGLLGAAAALIAVGKPSHDVGVATMGLAYSQVAGTMQPHHEGGPQALALQIGFASRAAINAWDLANDSFRGPEQIFEGKFGWFELIEGAGDPVAFVNRLGTQWEITRLSHKPFPSGRASHCAIDGVLQLQLAHGFALADVERIVLRVPSLINNLVGRPPYAGMPAGVARLCGRFLVPSALLDRGIDVSTYREERLSDPDLLAAAERVVIEVDDNPNPNALEPQHVRVDLRDGRTLEIHLPEALGSPKRPLTREQHLHKFRTNLALAGREDRSERIIELVDQLDTLDDVRQLFDLL
jgi:aconitate decarboxylase